MVGRMKTPSSRRALSSASRSGLLACVCGGGSGQGDGLRWEWGRVARKSRAPLRLAAGDRSTAGGQGPARRAPHRAQALHVVSAATRVFLGVRDALANGRLLGRGEVGEGLLLLAAPLVELLVELAVLVEELHIVPPLVRFAGAVRHLPDADLAQVLRRRVQRARSVSLVPQGARQLPHAAERLQCTNVRSAPPSPRSSARWGSASTMKGQLHRTRCVAGHTPRARHPRRRGRP